MGCGEYVVSLQLGLGFFRLPHCFVHLHDDESVAQGCDVVGNDGSAGVVFCDCIQLDLQSCVGFLRDRGFCGWFLLLILLLLLPLLLFLLCFLSLLEILLVDQALGVLEPGLSGMKPTHVSVRTMDIVRESKSDYTYRTIQITAPMIKASAIRPQKPLTSWPFQASGSLQLAGQTG